MAMVCSMLTNRYVDPKVNENVMSGIFLQLTIGSCCLIGLSSLFFKKMGQEFIVILFVTNVLSKTFLKIILKQMIAILHLLNDQF
jgi:hypothetical protein